MADPAASLNRPQRYDLVTNYRCGESIEELKQADDGEWVRWEDVVAERYLDSVEITVFNIGEIRRSLFLPWDTPWNGWVRDETAAREKPFPPAPEVPK